MAGAPAGPARDPERLADRLDAVRETDESPARAPRARRGRPRARSARPRGASPPGPGCSPETLGSNLRATAVAPTPELDRRSAGLAEDDERCWSSRAFACVVARLVAASLRDDPLAHALVCWGRAQAPSARPLLDDRESLSKGRGAPVNLSSCFPVLSPWTYVDVATVVAFNASSFPRTGTSRRLRGESLTSPVRATTPAPRDARSHELHSGMGLGPRRPCDCAPLPDRPGVRRDRRRRRHDRRPRRRARGHRRARGARRGGTRDPVPAHAHDSPPSCPAKNTMDPRAQCDAAADRPPDRPWAGAEHTRLRSLTRNRTRWARDPRGRHSGSRVGERRGRPPRLTPQRAGGRSARAGLSVPGAAAAPAGRDLLRSTCDRDLGLPFVVFLPAIHGLSHGAFEGHGVASRSRYRRRSVAIVRAVASRGASLTSSPIVAVVAVGVNATCNARMRAT